MSEVSSLHEEDHRNNLRNDLGRLRNQAMTPIQDIEMDSLPGSGYRHHPAQRPYEYSDDGFRGERRPRTRSVDDLDDLDRRDRHRSPPDNPSRGRRGSDDDSSRGYGRDARSPDPRDEYYGGKRSRSRDDLREYDRSRQEPAYDDRFLEDALRRKQQQRAGSRDGLDSVAASSRSEGRRNRRNDDDDFPPPPPPYTENESVSSRGKKLKKVSKVTCRQKWGLEILCISYCRLRDSHLPLISRAPISVSTADLKGNFTFKATLQKTEGTAHDFELLLECFFKVLYDLIREGSVGELTVQLQRATIGARDDL